ncbi:hypothetical protein [Antarcticibacterium sp. 1MA-6-2]|nr:hypothetical protein [Antarcticibacterium sp. 1MA-6-2]
MAKRKEINTTDNNIENQKPTTGAKSKKVTDSDLKMPSATKR